MSALKRRDFLKLAAGAAGAISVGPGCGGPAPPPDDGWDAGAVAHLLPSASHERILLKASFRGALDTPPVLRVDDRRIPGERTDSTGHFYRFDARMLDAATSYELRLEGALGQPLCDPWPLRTLPLPDAEPGRFRLLAYTCAGGPDGVFDYGMGFAYLPIASRQRLLARALAFEPDAVVANGDHVYWDMQSRFGWAMARSPAAWWVAGHFDRTQPILGTDNEAVLKKAFGPQIAGLYGVRFRSHPTFFLQDDHDYAENDEASAALRTFPADAFMQGLARTTQRLYYPELLADPSLPAAHVAPDGTSESFGSLRYGRLFEALLYDCRRDLTNAADPGLGHRESRFVPADVEAWLAERSVTSPCAHLAHMPSTPILWTAGKWGEWYPDGKDAEGTLRADVAKPYWAEGWAQQHDRLLAAAAAHPDRTPLFVSGDLHAIAAGRIRASHGAALERPVVSVLSGAVGTGWFGWPSRFRDQRPLPSGTLDAEEWIRPLEENGFTLLDFTPRDVTLSFFRWTPEQGEAALDRLEPFRVITIARGTSQARPA